MDFHRNWSDQKNGFGNLDGELWLGLDKIYPLTGAAVTHLLNTMAIPSQPRIRTITAMTVTVLRNLKEPCDTWPVIAQTSTVTIIVGNTHRMLMKSTSITGKVTITLRGELS